MFLLSLREEKLGITSESHRISRDFPCGPAVKNLPSNTGDEGLTPGWGTKIPHTSEQLSLCATTRGFMHCNGKIPHEAVKTPHSATKTRYCQINKYFWKESNSILIIVLGWDYILWSHSCDHESSSWEWPIPWRKHIFTKSIIYPLSKSPAHNWESDSQWQWEMWEERSFPCLGLESNWSLSPNKRDRK